MAKGIKSAAKKSAQPHRIQIDFPNLESAVEWFNSARASGHIPDRAGLFVPDALDEVKITQGRRLIVRSQDDGRSADSRVA